MTRSLTIVASRRLRGHARTMDAGRDYGQPRKFHHAGQRVPVEVYRLEISGVTLSPGRMGRNRQESTPHFDTLERLLRSRGRPHKTMVYPTAYFRRRHRNINTSQLPPDIAPLCDPASVPPHESRNSARKPVGEYLGQPFLAHRLHRDAIDQAIAFVGTCAVQFKPGDKGIVALRNDTYTRITQQIGRAHV